MCLFIQDKSDTNFKGYWYCVLLQAKLITQNFIRMNQQPPSDYQVLSVNLQPPVSPVFNCEKVTTGRSLPQCCDRFQIKCLQTNLRRRILQNMCSLMTDQQKHAGKFPSPWKMKKKIQKCEDVHIKPSDTVFTAIYASRRQGKPFPHWIIIRWNFLC